MISKKTKVVTKKKSTDSGIIKIVFVITGLGTGGAEMMLFKLLTRIDRNKFYPTVISLMEGGIFVNRIEALHIPVSFLGLQQGKPNPLGILRLKKLLDTIKPDLIQGWMYHANFIALITSLFTKIKVPVLWSIHHSIDSLKNEKLSLVAIIKLTAFLSKKPNKVVFSANKGKSQHLSLGYNASNAITINDNFDLSLFRRVSNSRFDLRSFLRIPEDSILIGSLARYHPMKDHINLIDGASKIIEDYPEVHFVLAGPNVDNTNYELNSRIVEFGIKHRVHLLGEIQYVAEFMKSLNIFTSSSAYGESFPNVIGEAMTCETPCVTTNVGDSKIIVGNTGLVIPPQNSDALIKAWQKLIEMGELERKNLGKKARTRIKKKFDVDGPNSFVRKYEEIYEDAISCTG